MEPVLFSLLSSVGLQSAALYCGAQAHDILVRDSQVCKEFKWPSWVIYDINFRQETASKPTLALVDASGHREPKIYQQCFNGMEKDPMEGWHRLCLSLHHTTSLCPSAPSMPQQQPIHQRKRPMVDNTLVPTESREICRNYNTKGCEYPNTGMPLSSAMEAILNTGAPCNQRIWQFIRCHLVLHLCSNVHPSRQLMTAH